jgi:hypothetical protein
MRSYLLIIYLVIAFVFQSCKWGDNSDIWERTLFEPIPTQKEKNFIAHLDTIGYRNIELGIPVIGYKYRGGSSYIVYLDGPFELTESNRDSINDLTKNIALDLYNNVIEDSLIYDFGKVKINLSLNYVNPPIKKRFVCYQKEYPKDSLEVWSGFKVVTDGKGGFNRVLI